MSYGNGYCLAGEKPVLMPPVDTFACLGDIVAGVRAERAVQRAADEAAYAARMAVHIKAPTRAERVNSLRRDIDMARAELQGLDNTQRWGRWTQDEFARKCAPARARIALAKALLADMGDQP